MSVRAACRPRSALHCFVHEARPPQATASEAWGWHGRTLGRPVRAASRTAWLRLASAAVDDLVETYWAGNLDADRHIPVSVPRPRLLAWHGWTEGEHIYRAELFEHVSGQILTPAAARDMPPSWWASLRAAIAAVGAISTTRRTVEPAFLNWAVPHYLGIPAELASIPWTAAHGDLRWSNLTGPPLRILDWEGWGLAPIGYDAATLRLHSRGEAALVNRLQQEFPILETPVGRRVEVAVLAENLRYGAASAT